MIKKLENIRDIFKIDDFRKDLNVFSIVVRDALKDSREIYSDNDNYVIIIRDDFTIVWTKDNIDIVPLLDVVNIIENFSNNTILCKRELASILDIGIVYDEINCMQCKKIRKPKGCSGFLYLPTNYDIDILSKCFFEYAQETNYKKINSLEDAYGLVQRIMDENYIYAWKEGKTIVSMASYSSYGNQSKISNVYTIPEARKKGYAQNLIYAITNEMLNDDMIPSIYIKDNVSKSLYKKIGYDSVGDLLMFNNNKVKIKSR